MASHEVPSASDSRQRAQAAPPSNVGEAEPIVSGLGTAVHNTHSSSEDVHPLQRFVERINSRQAKRPDPLSQPRKVPETNSNRPTSTPHHAMAHNDTVFHESATQPRDVARTLSASSSINPRNAVTTPPPTTYSRASTPSMNGSSALLHYFRYNIPLEYREPNNDANNNFRRQDVTQGHSSLPSGGEMRTVKDWLRRNREKLQATGAATVTPHVSNRLSAIPRTLADKAIRLSGYRSASALARAFETTPSAEVIMHDNRIRFGERILSAAGTRR